uniref:Uncharacterized protein n=1 Tax=Romanomermis culicivorax TaxID=13658 RepID=A0A915JMK9_ROMCU
MQALLLKPHLYFTDGQGHGSNDQSNSTARDVRPTIFNFSFSWRSLIGHGRQGRAVSINGALCFGDTHVHKMYHMMREIDWTTSRKTFVKNF